MTSALQGQLRRALHNAHSARVPGERDNAFWEVQVRVDASGIHLDWEKSSGVGKKSRRSLKSRHMSFSFWIAIPFSCQLCCFSSALCSVIHRCHAVLTRSGSNPPTTGAFCSPLSSPLSVFRVLSGQDCRRHHVLCLSCLPAHGSPPPRSAGGRHLLSSEAVDAIRRPSGSPGHAAARRSAADGDATGGDGIGWATACWRRWTGPMGRHAGAHCSCSRATAARRRRPTSAPPPSSPSLPSEL